MADVAWGVYMAVLTRIVALARMRVSIQHVGAVVGWSVVFAVATPIALLFASVSVRMLSSRLA